MIFTKIHYYKSEGIATITLNRPERLNALDNEMVQEWTQALEDARLDPEIRAVIVTGEGRAFCSGADLTGGLGLSETAQRETLPRAAEYRNWLRDSVHYVPRSVTLLDKPYIAAVNGVAVGAGMDMASMCDIRIAANIARFSMGYVRIGIVPGDGGCFYLPRIVGISKALELIWTGDFITADEALKIGYVSKVVSPEELISTTKEFAKRLAQGPSVAIQLAKRLVYHSLHSTVHEALDQAGLAMAMTLSTEDLREGFNALKEKRQPKFTEL